MAGRPDCFSARLAVACPGQRKVEERRSCCLAVEHTTDYIKKVQHEKKIQTYTYYFVMIIRRKGLLSQFMFLFLEIEVYCVQVKFYYSSLISETTEINVKNLIHMFGFNAKYLLNMVHRRGTLRNLFASVIYVFHIYCLFMNQR